MIPCIDETKILGQSAAIRQAISRAARLAGSNLPILLVGATGTGKELFAQEIHRWSGRPGKLVDINCAALPRDVVEGLLFGAPTGCFHRRGGKCSGPDRRIGPRHPVS